MVELMVGMVIALLGTLAIFQVFALSEGQKRSTTSASDSQQNGSLALLSIERDIRQAGYGIFDASLLGCNVSLYDKVRGGNYSFPMAPVVITLSVAAASGVRPAPMSANFAAVLKRS